VNGRPASSSPNSSTRAIAGCEVEAAMIERPIRKTAWAACGVFAKLRGRKRIATR
jgi:hypothetical protein